MSPELHVTIPGIFAAAVILVAVTAVLWWMLHPEAQRRSGFTEATEASNTVLVPVNAQTSDELLHLAGMLADEAHGDVMLLYVVEVPYTLPLDVQGPAGNGYEFLRDFRKHLEEEGLNVQVKVARSRRAGKAIVDWARAVRPLAIVVGAVPHQRGLVGTTTSFVLENAGPTRVVVYKG